MGRTFRSRRFIIPVLVGLATFGALYLAVAAPYLSSREEEMSVGETPVVVTYADTASADDLGLPLYPGAAVADSFAYTVTAKDGKPVSRYAFVALTTADPPEKVAEFYRTKLPGQPKVETVEGESGARRVLAVGNDKETRTVTIIETSEGSRIELVRAARPASPAKPLKPRRRESFI
jgi:hypothetical protein